MSAVAPGGGTPSGSVLFYTNEVALGSPVALSEGVASIATALLPHGSNTVRVEYAGDGNFLGSTNSLSPDQIINTPPATRTFALGANRNTPVNISATKLAKTVTDADGDPVSISAISSASAQGGTVSLEGSTITYTPPTDYIGADSFTYTVTDGFNPTTGTVDVTVRYTESSSLINNIVSLPDGNTQISASGIPGYNYLIQATTTTTDPASWTTIGTNAADSAGVIVFGDLNATNYNSRYYRLAAPLP
jgi:hypothetical protein